MTDTKQTETISQTETKKDKYKGRRLSGGIVMGIICCHVCGERTTTLKKVGKDNYACPLHVDYPLPAKEGKSIAKFRD